MRLSSNKIGADDINEAQMFYTSAWTTSIDKISKAYTKLKDKPKQLQKPINIIGQTSGRNLERGNNAT